ncbi:MCE family protein [Amycolatopsis sp. CA-230715]|uniref:MCE family protein n=1 Tax=Amycolatopsis sp. CA-230715 TaxID=2745196 RepID=UPI001C02EB87|nr:MlaD family protein [Amycolatopsis sp. CA-230715]QWF82843.1 hypothetical protein HUW46_06282 [Amycolatopsis sp. CA-230715]
MISVKVRVQVIAFVVIALVVVAFIGAKYAGLGRAFGGGYVVKLELAEGGGVFTNGEVTYRGVAVGRVGELRLTDAGMEADLLIDSSAPDIPVNSRAVVANRSAVGEQYVDLQPRTGDGPFLTDGATIPKESTAVPLPVQTLLGNLSAFTGSVPTGSLRTVVDELGTAFTGTGGDLQKLIDSASEFTKTASQHLPQTTSLLDDGRTVLSTQVDSSGEWRSFSSNAKKFAAELAKSDGDLRKLIGAAPEAATQLTGLLRDTNPGLSVLLANLLTTSNLVHTRMNGLEQLFSFTPQAVDKLTNAISHDTGHLSIVLTWADPPPCTSGYGGTQRRSPYDTSPAPFNLNAKCALPHGDPSLVRGAQNAPKGGVPPATVPGSGLLGPPLRVSKTLEEMLWLKK